MKIAIVTTTINTPTCLMDYAANFKKYGHKEVTFYVAGDEKTPPVDKFFERLDATGYDANYYDLAEQKDMSPDLDAYIPHNSIQRRNFAILAAYRAGADWIISIDDDNLIDPDNDYIKAHIEIPTESINVGSSNTGWLDASWVLLERQHKEFHHRGFPLNQRGEYSITLYDKKISKVAVNAGLWLGAPDTDAVAWINNPDLDVDKFAARLYGPKFALEFRTWCPFNSQNTAIRRDVITAYFMSPCIGRYDDIWPSYVVRKIADHLGEYITYGEPIVTQKRNPHDYLKDLENEIYGMRETPDFVKALRGMELTGKTYRDCVHELVDGLPDKYLDIDMGYRLWMKAIE